MSTRRVAVPAWLRVVREPLSAAEVVALSESGGRIRAPADVFRFLHARLASELQETFVVVTLTSQSAVIGCHEVTRGILNASLVHPREVFAPALMDRAAGLILCHNHPSGDPTPSADDRAATKQLVEAGRVLDMPVYDHVVIGAGRYVSFAEAGLL